MAILFESIPLNGIRPTHLEQLFWYIKLQERTGLYYGDYKHFMNRHDDLIELVGGALAYSKEKGVKLPKRIKNE